MRFLFLACTFLCLSGGIESGLAAAPADCGLLLQDGLFDYRGTQVDKFHYQQAKHWLETHDYGTYAKAEDDAANLGIGISVFQLQFGSKSAEQDFVQWRKDFISSTYEEVVSKDNYKEILKTVNVGLAREFTKCVGESYGTQIWIDAASDIQFDVHFGFRPPVDTTIVEVDTWSFNVSNAMCDPTPESVKTVGPARSLHCKKTSPDDVSVATLSTKQFGPKGPSPAFVKFVEPPIVPFGISAVAFASGDYTTTTRSQALGPAYISQGGTGTEPELKANVKLVVASDPNDVFSNFRSDAPPEQCRQTGADVARVDNVQAAITFHFSCHGYRSQFTYAYPDLSARFYADVATHMDLNSPPILFVDNNAARPGWKLNVTKGLDPTVKWQTYYDVVLRDQSGVQRTLYRRKNGDTKPEDPPFKAIPDSDGNLNIVLWQAAPADGGLADVKPLEPVQ
ncbi:hypothetical protein NKH53_26860 [Mesorhizobium australicum]|uniref:hypothetical protein n=1 Tax=Mesorhizobium australicum TaxID=536018 RepID=UPI0033350049